MPIKTILVVDDSPTERHLLTQLLQSAGYEVSTAEGGDEGVERAKQSKPDLVIMDVVMPGTNGFQATRALSRDETTKDCLLYTSPSPRDRTRSRMPSSA